MHARVERFVEPSLLLLLRERPLHGYELLERIPELGVEGRVDIGNLYRLLRCARGGRAGRSEWSADLPGPAKRTYELTDEGRRLLDRWAEALRRAQETIGTLSRTVRGEEVNMHRHGHHRGRPGRRGPPLPEPRGMASPARGATSATSSRRSPTSPT